MISLVINCDTRAEKNQETGLFNGVCNEDFLTDGILNKIAFLKGFEIETIVFIDEHLPVPEKTLEYLRSIVDCVVLRKHTNEEKFNDYNYLSALALARGEIICHIDQDTACFTSDETPIKKMIQLLEDYKFVSYPSHWSPNAVYDESFGGRMWASTRFFMCKRDTLKFDTLRRCLETPDWAYETFGDSPRKCNWLEHFLTLSNSNSVYYPEIELDKYAVFSWASYEKWTLRRLNELPYQEIKNWISSKGGIQYPVDVRC